MNEGIGKNDRGIRITFVGQSNTGGSGGRECVKIGQDVLFHRGLWCDPAPCKHVLKLRNLVRKHKLTIRGETVGLYGATVHVCCGKCKQTYDVILQEPYPVM